MNKFKYLLLLAIVFIILPNTIYADCTEEEITHFKEIEDEYKITYEFDEESKDYIVTFTNPEPTKYIYIITINDDSECIEKEANKLECKHVPPDDYQIKIRSANNSCTLTYKTIELNLSKYNPYFNDPLCEGIEEFVLCQETYGKEIDYDTFISRVNTYKKTKQNQTPEEEKNDTKIINDIFELIKENLFQIIIIIVFVIAVAVTIILTVKSIRKSRRLE